MYKKKLANVDMVTLVSQDNKNKNYTAEELKIINFK